MTETAPATADPGNELAAALLLRSLVAFSPQLHDKASAVASAAGGRQCAGPEDHGDAATAIPGREEEDAGAAAATTAAVRRRGRCPLGITGVANEYTGLQAWLSAKLGTVRLW